MDEAAALYQELANTDNTIIAKDTINFELAQIYQKQGKTEEAANLYFQIAKTASEAKDADGKANSDDANRPRCQSETRRNKSRKS